jgi:hypothetical protein
VPWSIDLQIENPQPAGMRPAFSEGDQIFLSATVSRTSHLYCYYVDTAGAVTRLLPNALQLNTLVSANQAVRIPDWMSANPGFILDAGKPGTEGAICMATAEDAMPKLPAELQGPALTAVKDVQGIPGLQQRFQQALGADGYVAQIMRWSVVGRKAPADSNGAN